MKSGDFQLEVCVEIFEFYLDMMYGMCYINKVIRGGYHEVYECNDKDRI